MSDTNEDQIKTANADSIMEEAQRLLAEIRQFRTQAEEQFKAAEVSRKNADSEGLFAFNAKKACEDHATTISQIKGNVESDVNTIRSNKQSSDELLAALIASKGTIDADGKTISELRKKADSDQASIGTVKENCVLRSQEIDNSKLVAEEALKAINESREAANLAHKSAETSRKEVDTYSTDAGTLVKQISADKTTSTEYTVEIQTALENTRQNEKELETILEHLKKSDEISSNHETRVAKLTEDLELLIERVDKLLPGAASASLASSFNKQKNRFALPQKRWLITFIGCILGLVSVSLPSFLAALGIPILGHSENGTPTELLRSLMLRMPILIPLVWLAIYAGRNYMLSMRIEEEYAYKEAVSTAFEGYKREMKDIDAGDAANPSPLTKLCNNILAAIAERPGRIYEGKQKDITLLNESHGAAQEITKLAKKQIATE